MKNIFILALITSIIVSCNNNSSEEGEQKEEKKISSRDYSITPANAYNDIFIDSTNVQQFVDTVDASNKIKRRIKSFYNARNYQFAWFASDGLTEQARRFWNLYQYDARHNHDSLQLDKKMTQRMENLFAQDNAAISAGDRSAIQTELTLTKLFIQHGLEVYEDGYVKRKEMERFVPLKKVDALYIADSLLNKKHKDNKYFEDINASYKSLKEQLGRYLEIAKNGGWPTIPTNEKKIKPGASSPTVAMIKRSLFLTGDLPQQDTTPVYNDTLAIAVKRFQERHGFNPDGVIDEAMIKQLNVPITARVQQLLINLDRMRWMPSKPSGKLILVNIPEFVLHVMENNTKVFDMPVVVGKAGNNTTIFTDDLNQIVFSPHWNVPSSIVKEEILPAMERNPNYLASQNMEIVSDGGELPTIRQKPGPGNALGKVKFLFPNSFNIYFHDTPAKSLFNREKRAFSHGCIRLQDPFKMASYLLKDKAEWTPEKINAAMNSGEEKFVKLDNPVPVFITYYTAWVDEQGRLNFREDIYGHDAKIAKKMFINNAASLASAQ